MSEDNRFQHLEVLTRNREKRTKYKKFVAEGVQPISLAVQRGWPIEAFIYSGKRKLSSWATDLLATSKAEYHLDLAEPLMEKLSDKDETSELLALVRIPDRSLDDLRFTNGLLVVFDRPTSPGNLGSAIRSADAFGADGFIVTGHAVDIYDPRVVRGSVGTLFALPVLQAPSHIEVLAWVAARREEGSPIQVIGTSASGELDSTEPDFTSPTVLIIGNETTGMSRGYRTGCDSVARLPIRGTASSLNVSCAVSIFLYEIDRQRRKPR